MRILMISEAVPYLPCHDGFRLVFASLLRELAKRHEIHLIAVTRGAESEVQTAWAREYCRSYVTAQQTAGLPATFRALAGICEPDLVTKVDDALRTANPEIIHVEGGAMASIFRGKPAGIPKVLCIHDTKSLRLRDFAEHSQQTQARIKFQTLFRLARLHERRWYRYADKVVVISQPDADALVGAIPAGRVTVIPGGVDLDRIAFRPAPEAGRIVLTGNMSWAPNEDAAEHFACDVFPKIRARVPDASFWIVGADPSARLRLLERTPGVHVTGTVPDLCPWLWSAAAYVSPIRFGRGVKIKILEAMAAGAPIVATSRSLSGTELIDGVDALIADDDSAFADAVVRLLGDPALRTAISREARKKVEREFSWPSIAAQFEGLYTEMLGRVVS
ncbi:MAG TPA: glycosyltransferase family 4 protein [Candidatus Binataceae bacterium]|nr:glycosyltransferase family 4 protein [Candidatus Binataceae bacterium]